MKEKDELIKIFAMSIRTILTKAAIDFGQVQEIRLRAEQPLVINYRGCEYFVSKSGRLEQVDISSYVITRRDLNETMEYIANYSLYAYEEELRQGFLTIQGGHRVGVAGRIVLENDRVKHIKYISFINVRLSHEIKGCADKVMPYLVKDKRICHTLIISPPRCGKTTLLRDMIRQISNGGKYLEGNSVGVVDERSEIGGAYLGVPQNDLGIRTDLLDCCPKGTGMMMLIRSMSPKVIAVDEIGDYEDIKAIESVVNCGCRLIATVHGIDIEDIRKKPLFKRLLDEQVFERYISLHNLGGVGTVKMITDEEGQILYKGGTKN